ncbi:MAG: hypothetical protein KBC73_00740 [Burkholderiaceae bacterium]|nr:hypothetical protein [Burkholderiaceae bacterium]
MNALSQPEQRQLSLVEIVDFKWLMAGAGHGVHVERLQTDPVYAQQCLCQAVGSRVPALRAAARHIARCLGVVLPSN